MPALKTEGAEPGKTLSMREAMTRHRANPACAGCHARMDPIGFAMENFDAVGRWRDRRRRQRRSTRRARFPDGTTVDGVAGLKQLAADASRTQFVDAMAEKLLMYALGRNLQYLRRAVDPADRRAESAASNYTFASLVVGVVKSVPFEFRTKSQTTR